MIHTAGHINMRMPQYMYNKIAAALNRDEKPINSSKVFFIGVAYKPDINDERESPATKIMDITSLKGGVVNYHDPHIQFVKTEEGYEYHSMELTKENVEGSDCVVLTTNHKQLDLNLIKRHAKMIVDLRNMIEERNPRIYKL